MQSGSNVNWTHSSGSFFTVKFRLLFNMNPPYELTGVFRKMTLPGMMALLPLEHTSPFIPLRGKCFGDIFNLSSFHHTFHPSNVLCAAYPQILFTQNTYALLMCGCMWVCNNIYICMWFVLIFFVYEQIIFVCVYVCVIFYIPLISLPWRSEKYKESSIIAFYYDQSSELHKEQCNLMIYGLDRYILYLQAVE